MSPSHPRAGEAEHGFGRGKARAGSARSAHRQATTSTVAHVEPVKILPSTRARAEQAGGGHQELCTRMRETGRTSCTILFCEGDVLIETEEPGSGEIAVGGARRSA